MAALDIVRRLPITDPYRFDARPVGFARLFQPSDIELTGVDDTEVVRGWYDPAVVTTITEVSGLVSQLDNKGPLSQVIGQSTGSRQPLTDALLLNNLNVLNFGGTDWLFLDDIFDIGSSGNLVVMSINQITTVNQSNDGIFSYGTSELGNSFALQSNNVAAFDGSLQTYDLGPIDTSDCTGGPYDTGYMLYNAVLDFDNSEFYTRINGTECSPRRVYDTKLPTVGSLFWNNIVKGNRAIVTDGAEFIVLQTSDIDLIIAVEGYLAWKSFAEGVLPANHRYKDAPPIIVVLEGIEYIIAGDETPVLFGGAPTFLGGKLIVVKNP